MKVFAAVVCMALFALPARAWQATDSTLAEVAEKEKERRKNQKKPARTFTEWDLHGAGGTVSVSEGNAEASSADAKAAAGQAAGAKKEKKEKTDDELRADKRADYLKKIDEQQRIIAAVRKDMDTAQRELGDTTNYTFGTRRQALQKVMDDGQREIAKAQQSIADIEEEARRQGISLSR